MRRFAEHEVVLPVVVITELEAKRHHPELGFFARTALRVLDELRVTHGRLDEAVPGRRRGRLDPGRAEPHRPRVPAVRLPAGGQRHPDPRRRSQPRQRAPRRDLVSKDLPMRIKASAVGLRAEEYHAEHTGDSDPGYSGMAELEVPAAVLDELYDVGSTDLESARELPCHTGLVLLSERGTALGRVGPDKHVHLVRGDREAFGIHGRSAEQRIALEMLLDPEVGIVSLGGRAGTGKSAMALCAGLEAVLERRHHQKVVVFRPLFAGRRPGARLPARLGVGEDVALGPGRVRHARRDHLARRDRGGARPRHARGAAADHIRGRSLHDAFVIVDEAQSLERNVLLTVLSRIGANSKVVLTHDVAQRDNLRVGRHDGVVAVVEKLKGHPLFAHVTLTRSERSPIAAW
jgi:PhoH-like ATPase